MSNFITPESVQIVSEQNCWYQVMIMSLPIEISQLILIISGKCSSDFEEVCPWKAKCTPLIDLMKGVKWEGEMWYFCPKCVTGIWVTTHDVSTHTKVLESAELEKMKICNLDFYTRCMWISGWLYTYKVKMFEPVVLGKMKICNFGLYKKYI